MLSAVNLGSYFWASKAALKHFVLKRAGASATAPTSRPSTGSGGVIVNIASVQGLLSQRGVPAYAASKGGILSLTRQLAVEYGSYGIRVNAVCPGTIDTPLVRRNMHERGLDIARAADPYPIGEDEDSTYVI
jgi:NAD(P)-dependent dehydrogenase (short-subunit alcohol dehydrogenase family)